MATTPTIEEMKAAEIAAIKNWVACHCCVTVDETTLPASPPWDDIYDNDSPPW